MREFKFRFVVEEIQTITSIPPHERKKITMHHFSLEQLLEHGHDKLGLPARLTPLECPSSSKRLIGIDEYIGITDKHDGEIYDGDITKTTSELMTNFGKTPTGEYQEDYFLIEYDKTEARFKERNIKTNHLRPLGLSQSIIGKYSEVIGNKWENPELLKESGK